MLAAVVMLGMLGLDIGVVNAASTWKISAPSEIWAGTSGVIKVTNDEGKEAKIKSVKSSNENVIVIKKQSWVTEKEGEYQDVYVMASQKKGKATITVKYKAPGSKKTKTLTKKVKVKKYPNEINSLVVNGKKINVDKHKFSVSRKTSRKAVTVKLALQNNWKVSNVSGTKYKSGTGKYVDVKVTKKMLANGSEIKFPSKYDNMVINVTMKKGDETITYSVSFHR